MVGVVLVVDLLDDDLLREDGAGLDGLATGVLERKRKR